MYAIRLTLLAKAIKACTLPHFVSLEYSHGLYQLKIQKPSLCLRDALEAEEFVHDNGHMVIKGLLTMLLELREVNATIHSLTPDGIYVSSLGTRLAVTNLFGVTFTGMRVLDMPRGSMPYSNHDLLEHQLTGYHNQERSLWSVGMIIFELFVGPELVQCFKTNSDVQDTLVYLSS